LGLAALLDVWAGHETPTILGLSAFGSLISYIYSAPPLKLKQVREEGRDRREGRRRGIGGRVGGERLGPSFLFLPSLCHEDSEDGMPQACIQ
jgi:hypothetical protein